jgi:hypothetical protein
MKQLTFEKSCEKLKFKEKVKTNTKWKWQIKCNIGLNIVGD